IFCGRNHDLRDTRLDYLVENIFELGKEVVGYTDIEEVPELVKYYLAHETERQHIAIAGFKRAKTDYNEVTVWDKQMRQIAELI
ncbi:glycosyltransferase family 1 protein, partial [bacterium]|nr:glycosyltransferase family 1 protein [bacterium]